MKFTSKIQNKTNEGEYLKEVICLTNKYLLESFYMSLIVTALAEDQNCNDKKNEK
jgi:hypothetical protein